MGDWTNILEMKKKSLRNGGIRLSSKGSGPFTCYRLLILKHIAYGSHSPAPVETIQWRISIPRAWTRRRTFSPSMKCSPQLPTKFSRSTTIQVTGGIMSPTSWTLKSLYSMRSTRRKAKALQSHIVPLIWVKRDPGYHDKALRSEPLCSIENGGVGKEGTRRRCSRISCFFTFDVIVFCFLFSYRPLPTLEVQF